ncbi:glycosyltransferase [Rhodococcus sp. RDE2]|uniref:glycosyltransferase n=1 Tax=Rhodococcus sp. RDE2 TaxID=2885078 RepID=UPI001E5A49BB|nr:glycosyltransferase [Rhodococcus sp. RDE2]
MKVLHIVPLVSDDSAFGGPVRGTARQSHALTEKGHECQILGLWRGAGDTPDEVLGVPATLYKFKRLPGHRFATALSLAPLRWIARNRKSVDVVHVHAGRDLWILLSMLLMRTLKIQYVWQTHGMLAPRNRLVYKLYDLVLTTPALRGASQLLYLTDYERRDLEAVGREGGLVHVVNGVENIGELADSLSLPSSNEFRLAFISRIHPRKRLIDLVKAVEKVNEQGSNVYLDIYGPDEGALAEVTEEINNRSLVSHVSYKGALKYSEVRSTLREYHTMVLPSVNEPFPNIVLESLASGVPVILTNSCGLAPYIEDYKAGIVVEPGVDGLTRGIIEMMENPLEREHLRKAGLKLAEDKFTMSGVATELANIYGGVAG